MSEYLPPEAQESANPTSIVFSAIKIGLGLMGRRSLLLLALLGSFALFGYAALRPQVLTVITASLFTLFTFVPLLVFSKHGQ